MKMHENSKSFLDIDYDVVCHRTKFELLNLSRDKWQRDWANLDSLGE